MPLMNVVVVLIVVGMLLYFVTARHRMLSTSMAELGSWRLKVAQAARTSATES